MPPDGSHFLCPAFAKKSSNRVPVTCRRLDWTYVSMVYTDTEYGRHGWELLSNMAANYSVCIASPAHRIDKQDFTDDEAANVVLALNATEAKSKKCFQVLFFSRFFFGPI